MTVSEFIELLQKLPPNMEVVDNTYYGLALFIHDDTLLLSSFDGMYGQNGTRDAFLDVASMAQLVP